MELRLNAGEGSSKIQPTTKSQHEQGTALEGAIMYGGHKFKQIILQMQYCLYRRCRGCEQGLQKSKTADGILQDMQNDIPSILFW